MLIGGGFAYGYERLEVPYRVPGARLEWLHLLTPARDAYAESEQAAAGERLHGRPGDRRSEVSRRLLARPRHPRADRDLRLGRGTPGRDGVPADLAEIWDEVWAGSAAPGRIHFYAIRGPYQVLDDLADLYESVIDDAAPGDALRLIGGRVHELHEVERGLERLAAMAERTPIGRGRALGDPSVTLEDLAALPEARDVHRCAAGIPPRAWPSRPVVRRPGAASWIEEPDLLLTELAKRLEHPPAVDAETRRQRLADEADLMAERVRAALATDPERLERFESLLGVRAPDRTADRGPQLLDRPAGTVRRCAGSSCGSGRRLAEIGVIERRGRLPVPAPRRGAGDPPRAGRPTRPRGRAAGGPRGMVDGPSAADGRQGLHGRQRSGERGPVRRRRATTRPMPTRSAAPAPPPGSSAGPPGSTLGQEDFGAVQPGDIIVCPSSNPSWVPLFAIAGGLITNTGGVLSHAAVVAREFALPAVVGTGDATQRIADGRLVELDGTSGIVRLL